MTAEAATGSLQRADAQYDDLRRLSEPLLVSLASRKYNRQFATLYDYRLRRLKHPKGRLVKRATEQWTEGKGSSSHLILGGSQSSAKGDGGSSKRKYADDDQVRASYVKRILDVKQGQICFVVGTIYCSMHLKPDVLEELTREQYLPPQPPSEKYADPEKDEYYIEDESGRVRLVGDAVAPDGQLRSSLVTGVVVAILGTETRSGDFEVADALFAGVPDKSVRVEEISTKKEEGEDKQERMDVDDGTEKEGSWVALVGGLELEPSSASVTAGKSDRKENGNSEQQNGSMMMGYAEKEMKLMLLTDWLMGHVGDANVSRGKERSEASRITSLVVAGNCMNNALRGDEDKVASRTSMPVPNSSYPTSNLDDFLVDVTASMHVHLLPGEKDPTSLALPQQPMHHSLFPKASRFATLHRETNPTWFGIQGKKFLGSSGQNINDIFRYMTETDGDARLKTACRTLDWGHIAPTCPDTLSCYPLSDRDPFLIEETPDIYFVGNQPQFGSQIYQTHEGHSILVVLVPNFATTGEVVLIQPSTLAIKRVQVGLTL